MKELNFPKIEKKDVGFDKESSCNFIEGVIGKQKKLHFLSNESFESVRKSNKPEQTVSKFITSLHDAYDQHIPFTISPEVIWNIVLQEVASFVKENSDNEEIAALFTKNLNEIPTVDVRIDNFIYGSSNNDWLLGVSQFKNKMIELVPSDMLRICLPKLSTETMVTSVSHLIGFMDATSKYYKYSMSTLCGIPSIRVDGTVDDWHNLVKSAKNLQLNLFGLKSYFDKVISTLEKIRDTIDSNNPDLKWWENIYKCNAGSGGPYSNGWINNFYAYFVSSDYKSGTKKLIFKDPNSDSNTINCKLNNFPSNISVVPFTWNYYNEKYPMNFVSGITNVEVVDGFLTPKLGVGIFERESF